MLNRALAGRLALGCALLVSALSSPALAGGPPWISVEMPGDPTNPSSRGAVMLVRAYSCGMPTEAAVAGTAEGVVKGERRTIPLALEPAGAKGVYAVAKQWPSEGSWVLTFTMSAGGEVSTIVTLGPDGGVDPAEYHRQPTSTVRAASVRVLARKTTAADVDALLRAAATGEPAVLAAATPASGLGYLGAAAILAGATATVALGRRRRG